MAVAEGIYVGSAAEVAGVPGGEDINGLTCQVLEHLIDDDKCKVILTNGVTTEVETKYLKPPAVDSFDVMLGPCQEVGVVGEEISQCMFTKGFCLVKVCESSEKWAAAFAAMGEMEEQAKLIRLPEAVEAGYFGDDSPAKVCWLTEDSTQDASITSSDDLLASIVDSITPCSFDTLGDKIDSRTPALVSVSMKDIEASQYPYPSIDDKALYDYLQTYRQGLLRAVLFMGKADVMLKVKDGAALPGSPSDVEFTVGPGTVLLFKPKCFRYSVQASADLVIVQATFLSKPATPSLVAVAGGDADLAMVKGAKGPTKATATIENASTRMCASWDSPEMYSCGLAYGGDCHIEMPFNRFDWTPYHAEAGQQDFPWQFECKHMGYVEGLEYFDNKYFNLPANEVATMDTMHRHVLETGAINMYKLGISKKVADKQASHAGVAVALDKDDWDKAPKEQWCVGGANVQALLANRFSYTFNLKGASLAVDTACSSSLTAAHQGKQFLLDRGVDKMEFWIAIGLHQCLAMDVWMGNNLSHMFSSIGRCGTFNDTADGYLRGDNCSAIAMKWDSPDYAVKWRGSMVGQNGRAATLTAPNGIAQEDVIWKAFRDAGCQPAEGTVWSCHGTGTSLGDPIEFGAVRKVQTKEPRSSALMMNTNKVNTGHSEGGAAMTSLIAMMIQMTLQRCNGNIHLEVLNPHIDTSNFEPTFSTELGTTNATQAHGNVSSFGFGGTNGNAVMWGNNQSSDPSSAATMDLLKRFGELAPPEVRVIGNDPEDWEFDGFDVDAKSGDKYSVKVTAADPGETPTKKYELLEEALGEDYDESDVAYTIQGNFEGEEFEMEDGMVPGLKNVIVDVPESGEVEFNFYQTCQPELVLAPKANKCWKKSAPCEGPSEGLTNSWHVAAEPGSELRIDLFIGNGMCAVSWGAAELCL